jgi:hypothetical protein
VLQTKHVECAEALLGTGPELNTFMTRLLDDMANLKAMLQAISIGGGCRWLAVFLGCCCVCCLLLLLPGAAASVCCCCCTLVFAVLRILSRCALLLPVTPSLHALPAPCAPDGN